MVDDVISQGRESEREARPRPSRDWRGAGWVLAVAAAALAVTGLGLRHGPAPATAVVGRGAVAGSHVMPYVPAPAPQSHPAFVVCAPSTGACSMQGDRVRIVVHVREPIRLVPSAG